jgi:sialate O-acetylesterase
MLVYWGDAWLGTQENPLLLITKSDTLSLSGKWKYNTSIEKRLSGWQNYYNTYSVLYNAMIHPAMPYSISGILWYQGENNVGKGKDYRTLLPLLINDWRLGFKQGNLPFITVQLANHQKRKSEASNHSSWAELREAQAMSLMYPNTGLAVAIDMGEEYNIHPTNKYEVGRRLYLQACKVAYNDSLVVASGPTFKTMKTEGSSIRISFDNIGDGLMVKGKQLKGFSVADENQKFIFADAEIEGNEIVVSSKKISKPVAVRYAWENNPEATLYNRNNLPAVPFRTDNW